MSYVPNLHRAFDDPRVQQAKDLLLEVLGEAQGSLNKVREASPDLKADYQQTLDEFAQIRGGGLYYPYLSNGIGNGPFVELADGSVKLDMISGIGVHGLGHSHPRLVESGVDAALCDTVMQGNLQQHIPSFDLSRLLIQTANSHGAELGHVLMTTSGAMANENGLKVAFQNRSPANRVIAFRDCFAGRTLGLSQLTDRPAYRLGLPDTIRVDYVPFYEPDNHEHSITKSVGVLRKHLERYPGKHAAFVMELIQGEGGYYPGSRDFFIALIEELRRHEVLIMFDEIQTFGRTTQPFAFQHYQLDEYADIVTIGKITQICATMYREALKPKPGLLSQTFTGSSWAMMACQVVIEELLSRGHFGESGRNAKYQQRFANRLGELAKQHPDHIGGPYGLGGMMAFTPLNGTPADAKRSAYALYEAGLIGFVAGSDPARVRFLPPLAAIEEEHIDLMCDIIGEVIPNLPLED